MADYKLSVAIDAIDNASKTLQTVSTEVENFQKNVSNTTKKASSFSQSLSSFGQTATKVGGIMTLGLTAPLVAGFKEATEQAVDFETAFAKVKTIADSSQVPFDELSSQILELSSATGIASTEIADATYNAISAGQETSDAVNFVSAAAKLAKSGFTDMSTATDTLTTALNAYGLEAEQVTEVSDKLITTQNLGKTTVAELGASMGRVIPTAAAFGVNLDQLSSAFVTTTKNGIATAESATYINGMLNELGQSGTDVANVLKKKTGKSFKELMNQGYSLTDVLEIINEDAQESGLSIMDMFGSQEAAKAASSLIQHSEDFDEAVQAMGESAGTTEQAFSTMEDTTTTAMDKLKTAVQNSMAEIGENVLPSLVPVIQKVTDKIVDLSEKWNGLSESQQEMILKCAAFVAAAGPVLAIVGQISKAVSPLVGTVEGIVSSVRTAGGLAAAIVPKLAGIATALTGPAGIVIGLTAVAGFITAGLIKKANSQLSETTKAAEDLAESIESSQNAREDALDDIEANAALAKDLASRLEELQSQTSLTADEQNEMVSAVNQLNTLYPDLNLQLDETTGKLTEESEARLKNVDAMIQEARAAAAQEQLTEIAKEHIETEKQLNELYEQKTQLENEAIGNSTQARALQAKQVKETYDAIDELKNKQTELAEEEEFLTGIISDSTAKLDENTTATQENADAMEDAVPATEEVDAALEELVTQYEETAQAAYDSVMGQGNAFSELAETSEENLDDMITNLQANAQAYQDYADNLAAAMEWAANSTGENAQDLVQYIADMGTDGAGYLQELVDAVNSDDERLDELLSSFGDYQENVADYSESMAEMKTTTSNTTDEIESQFKTAGEKVAKELSNMSSTVSGTKFTLNSSNWHIQTPHFYAKRKAILNSYMSVPVVDVDWYASAYQTPIEFTSPTIVPTAGGFKGFGDGTGSEIVIGKNNLLNTIAEAAGRGGGNEITLNVYPSQGMDEKAIADYAIDALTERLSREDAVYA